MTRILLAGDWHGNSGALYLAMKVAEQQACDEIIQLGDFGYGWNNNVFTRRATKAVDAYGIPLLWLDGNHENFDMLDEAGFFGSEGAAAGPVEIAPGVSYIPRGTVLERMKWDGDMARILVIGGAHSVDKGWRTPHVSWWPQEEITGADVDRCLSVDKCEIVLSHDAPNRGFEAALQQAVRYDPNSEEDWRHLVMKNDQMFPGARPNRMALEAICEYHNPKQWFHGHYHTHYKAQVGDTEFVGLDCETQQNSMYILDL